MVRPVIGVSGYAEQARWGQAWDMPTTLLPRAYVDSLVDVGAAPVVLPPVPEAAVSVAERLDGLVLAGGGDIGPERYGAAPDGNSTGVQRSRDGSELGLLAAALEAGIPVLGICRGMQVLNVARGGTLHQHLPEVLGSDEHRQRLARFDPHPVTVAPDTHTARALGRTELDVPSYHHQGIAELGEGVVATAWAADGTVEALEYAGTPGVLGVQWHPEMGTDPSLFGWLTSRARAPGRRKGETAR
ncbi:putative glutamine amidotransferase [Haloactinospora alba]|uniref:Putative glutamine amidotransferase n=1 Tax=Haloactinospora alba TaxID=405555 RepID=A0A543NJW9_9ACTN|nr:gamma-glutamyl-gamma-aminobutyrate hydrolase family protein [Haloactinospora alba]TQN32107.1 putative glutamine amidotransferase [Haloactinospora alba]